MRGARLEPVQWRRAAYTENTLAATMKNSTTVTKLTLATMVLPLRRRPSMRLVLRVRSAGVLLPALPLPVAATGVVDRRSEQFLALGLVELEHFGQLLGDHPGRDALPPRPAGRLPARADRAAAGPL
jgi:hypothetical protein